MTDTQFIANIRAKLEIVKQGVPVLKAVVNTNDMRVQRIFENGLNSNNAVIGQYSTTPMYINTVTKSPKKIVGIGKYGEKIFKTGKRKGQPHKTTYTLGYGDFRKKIGKSNPTVNLDLFGTLKKDITKGFITSPNKVSGLVYEVGVSSPQSVDKIDGNTARFGEFMNHTKFEKEEFNRVLKLEIQKIIK